MGACCGCSFAESDQLQHSAPASLGGGRVGGRRCGRRSTSGSHATLAPAHQKIAETTQVSAPQVSKVLSRFDEQGWTTKPGTERGPRASRVIVDPAGLLGSWAARGA
jgi:hypothetical protein